MDTTLVDAIIQYAMTVASGHEDFRARELGPIHFVKYVYLVDLAYAAAHDGATFTGTPWIFHHFGPWSTQVWKQVEPALEAIGAYKKTIAGDKGDFSRWGMETSTYEDKTHVEKIQSALERVIGIVAALEIKKSVERYGSETNRLLHDIYLTPPMLAAAPGEDLDFTTAIREKKPLIPTPAPPLTERQKKRLAQKRAELKTVFAERMGRKMASLSAAKLKSAQRPQPRYDEVFFDGLRVLDELAGGEIQEERITCSISDAIWKSKARHDPELS